MGDVPQGTLGGGIDVETGVVVPEDGLDDAGMDVAGTSVVSVERRQFEGGQPRLGWIWV